MDTRKTIWFFSLASGLALAVPLYFAYAWLYRKLGSKEAEA